MSCYYNASAGFLGLPMAQGQKREHGHINPTAPPQVLVWSLQDHITSLASTSSATASAAKTLKLAPQTALLGHTDTIEDVVRVLLCEFS